MVSTATEAITLDKDAFMRLVTQERLKVEGPAQGYLYTGKQGRDGWELYKTYAGKKWVYQARRVATQANAGGGAIVVDVSLATGQIARLISAQQINSGTNTVVIRKYDEDNAEVTMMSSVASAAGTKHRLPITSTTTTSDNLIASTDLLILPGQKLSFMQTGAGLQNDTMTVVLELELYNLSTIPTWSVARSTNSADVTLAASTISDANTIQELVC